MAEESGRPGTCKSKVGCEAIDEPWTNRIVPMLFPGSPAHFSHRNSFTPPSLLVQCSSPLIGGLVISFIIHERLELRLWPAQSRLQNVAPTSCAFSDIPNP